jgi:hypothetical protein
MPDEVYPAQAFQCSVGENKAALDRAGVEIRLDVPMNDLAERLAPGRLLPQVPKSPEGEAHRPCIIEGKPRGYALPVGDEGMAGPLGPNGLSRTQPLGDDRATPQAARKGQESVKARTEIVGVPGLELAAICAPDHCDVANPIAAVGSKKIPDLAVIKTPSSK